MNTLTTEHTPDNIIARWLDDHQEELVNTADYIFHHPELAYQETLSSKCLADYLESQGFKITWKTAGIDTAFTAVWGGGSNRCSRNDLRLWLPGRRDHVRQDHDE